MLRPTLKDVAARAGVARSTASAILGNKPHCYASEETKKRVFDAARVLNYQPNMLSRGLLGQRTFNIGLCMHHLIGPNVRIEHMMMMQQSASGLGYRFVTGIHEGKVDLEEQHINACLSQRVDGIIIEMPTPETLARLEELVQRGMPIVVIDPPGSPRLPHICVDREHGGYLQVKHLVEQGRRRFVFITVTPDHYLGKAKNVGHIRALKEAGLDPDAQLWLAPAPQTEEPADAPAPTTPMASADGMVLTRKAMKLGFEFDAIACSADSIGLGVLRHLYQSGISVPDDVAVVGFHDEMFAAALPVSLSTIRHPPAIGVMAFEMLVEQIEGRMTIDERRERRAVEQPMLIPRESSVVSPS